MNDLPGIEAGGGPSSPELRVVPVLQWWAQVMNLGFQFVAGTLVIGAAVLYFLNWRPPQTKNKKKKKKGKKNQKKQPSLPPDPLLPNDTGGGVAPPPPPPVDTTELEQEPDSSSSSDEEQKDEEEEPLISLGPSLDRLLPHSWRRRSTVVLLFFAAVLLVLFFSYLLWSGSGHPSPSSPVHQAEDQDAEWSTVQHELVPEAGQVRFYYRKGYRTPDHKKRIPWISCHHMPWLEILQEGLLGPRKKTTVMVPAADPKNKDKKVREERYEDELREWTRNKCLRENDRLVSLDQDAQKHQLHLLRPVLTKLPLEESHYQQKDAQWLMQEVLVNQVYLSHDGSRYYRVQTIQQDVAHKKKPWVLGPTLIQEHDLLQAARHWYGEVRVYAKTKEGRAFTPNEPCLCLTHLGPLGTTLYLVYDPVADDWSLLVNPQVTRDDLSKVVETTLAYNQHIPFPSQIDKAYGVSEEQQHPLRLRVRYFDPVTQFDTAEGKAQVLTVLGHSALDMDEAQPDVLTVVDLASLWWQHAEGKIRLVGMKEREFKDLDSRCFVHCAQLQEKVVDWWVRPPPPPPPPPAHAPIPEVEEEVEVEEPEEE